VAAAVLSVLAGRSLRASESDPMGGPDVVRILGVDADQRRLYFEILHENMNRPWAHEVRCFDLDSPEPARSMRIPDSAAAALGRSLQPLIPRGALGYRPVMSTTVLSADTLTAQRCRRYRLQVSLDLPAGVWSDTLPAFGDSTVTILGTYSIPERVDSQRNELVLVIAWYGVVSGTHWCWEKQEAVLLPAWTQEIPSIDD
jgi:hypothetical protein